MVRDVRRSAGGLRQVRDATEFAKAFDPDAEDKKSPYIDVPYGIGQYKTLKDMVEYLAIILPDINKDAWRFHADATQN